MRRAIGACIAWLSSAVVMSLVDVDTVIPEAEDGFVEAILQRDMPSWFANEVNAIRSPHAAAVFSVSGLWQSIQQWDKKHPQRAFFGADETQNKIQLAAFLGNVAQETGNMRLASEMDHATGAPCTVASGNCAKRYGRYFGRGALQVTCWGGNFCSNYKALGDTFGVSNLEQDPDQVATNPILAWGSAVYFWTSSQGYGGLGPAKKWVPKRNFGGTYATINGNQECQPPTGPNKRGIKDKRVANRIAKFLKACKAAGVSCRGFKMSCPTVRIGKCLKRVTWDCKKNDDCGQSGPCCHAPDYCNGAATPTDSSSGEGTVDDTVKHCSNKPAVVCTRNDQCGKQLRCKKIAPTCSGGGSKVCKTDGDCGQQLSCDCAPRKRRCKHHPDWGCKSDPDCGDPAAGAQCVCLRNAGRCSNHKDWACSATQDCGESPKCRRSRGKRCSNHPDWACKKAADCGDSPVCS